MKKIILILFLSFQVMLGRAQSEEAQQLLLNVEKLAQFTKILKQMYDAYKILYKGYTAIKDISEGNFSLHKNFLDALLQVSPAVKKYKRVTDIIAMQIKLVKECKSASARFKSDAMFNSEEIIQIGKIYSHVVNASLQNLEDLALVITAGKLRMSDDERLQAIDRIYFSTEQQLGFVRDYNSSASILSIQRNSESADIQLSKRLKGF